MRKARETREKKEENRREFYRWRAEELEKIREKERRREFEGFLQ